MTDLSHTATLLCGQAATLVAFDTDDQCGLGYAVLDGVIDEGALVPCPDGDHDHRAAATLPLAAILPAVPVQVAA